jgi:hypothetical protein
VLARYRARRASGQPLYSVWVGDLGVVKVVGYQNHRRESWALVECLTEPAPARRVRVNLDRFGRGRETGYRPADGRCEAERGPNAFPGRCRNVTVRGRRFCFRHLERNELGRTP